MTGGYCNGMPFAPSPAPWVDLVTGNYGEHIGKKVTDFFLNLANANFPLKAFLREHQVNFTRIV